MHVSQERFLEHTPRLETAIKQKCELQKLRHKRGGVGAQALVCKSGGRFNTLKCELQQFYD